ncbi:hypothetical protein D9M68_176630 [compost metagenome]
MLCGVGGRTIAEAQQRLSYPEFLSWQKYRAKRGTLHVGMRIERGSALLATLYANTHSKRGGFKLDDFMPHADEPVLTLERAMETWH